MSVIIERDGRRRRSEATLYVFHFLPLQDTQTVGVILLFSFPLPPFFSFCCFVWKSSRYQSAAINPRAPKLSVWKNISKREEAPLSPFLLRSFFFFFSPAPPLRRHHGRKPPYHTVYTLKDKTHVFLSTESLIKNVDMRRPPREREKETQSSLILILLPPSAKVCVGYRRHNSYLYIYIIRKGRRRRRKRRRWFKISYVSEEAPADRWRPLLLCVCYIPFFSCIYPPPSSSSSSQSLGRLNIYF